MGLPTFRKYAALGGSLLAVLFSVLQSSRAQDSGQPVLEGPEFRIDLPPISGLGADDALTLPALPIYDPDNRHLPVRDSSQDWYPGPEEGFSAAGFSPQLRILPESSPDMLDETLVPIPPEN